MTDQQKRIEAELEKVRKRLLDLSFSNKLLNFRHTKRSTIKVVYESPEEVYAQLVLDQGQMRFKAAPELKGEGGEISLADIPFDEDDLTDRYLQTNLVADKLGRSLVHIKQKADTVFEEQGYTVLYLALGFLQWKESDSELTIRSAPLILIPVRLEKPTITGHHRVEWTEEELATNISLQAKLAEMQIELPEFEAPDNRSGLNKYFDAVNAAIQGRKGWEVTQDISLGFFSFTKFVMYKDITPKDPAKLTRITGNPLLRRIFIGEDGKQPGDGLADNDLDFDEQSVADINVRNQFHVLDADSSQIAVIETVKMGKNLVVEGPPGTGKSQTITNIIAELLGQKKKVLFVSEKMAALEVVKKRLESCGLGDSCLELHSRHTNKRAFLEELSRTLNIKPPAPPRDERIVDSRESVANELNDYVGILRRPLGAMNRTPFSLFGQYMQARKEIENRGAKLWFSTIQGVDKLTEKEYAFAQRCLKSLTEMIPALRPISKNPWRYCSPGGQIFDSDSAEIEHLLEVAIKTIDDLESSLFLLTREYGIKPPASRAEFAASWEAADCLSQAPLVEASTLLDERWNTISPQSKQLIDKIEVLQQQIAALEGRWDASFRSGDLSQLKEELQKLSVQLDHFTVAHNALSNLSGCCEAKTIEVARLTIEGAKLIARGTQVEPAILRNFAWNAPSPEATSLIEAITFLQGERNALDLLFKPNAYELAIADLYHNLEPLSKTPFRFFSPKFWKLRRMADDLHLNKTPPAQLVANLKRLAEYQGLQQKLVEQNSVGAGLYGSLWSGEKSNPENLREFSTWILAFRKCILDGTLTELAIELVSSGADSKRLESTVKDVETQLGQIESGLNYLSKKIGVPNIGIEGNSLDDVEFLSLDEVLQSWITNLDMLENWQLWRGHQRYKVLTNLVDQLYGQQANIQELLMDFERLRACLTVAEWIEKQDKDGKWYFSKLWTGQASSVKSLRFFSSWAVAFRKHFRQGALTQRAAIVVENGVAPDAIKNLLSDTIAKADYADSSLQQVIVRLGFSLPSQQGNTWGACTYLDWKTKLEDWHSHLKLLPRWTQYLSVRDEVNKTCASALIEPLENGTLETQDALPTLHVNIAQSLLRIAFAQYPVLRQFVAQAHERKIHEFSRLDSDLQRLCRQKLARQLFSERPKLGSLGGIGHESSAGILLGELNKKKKLMPIRKLMAVSGGLIQSVKPCFMMSPLSIAQFLEPEGISFDVVIFDEASQVRPEDALGAIMRGRQLVVMGDTKQLPPTSFFDKLDAEDEEDEDEISAASIADVESILHQCQRSFAKKTLRWHYRSRHESLIAVSNEQFYDNQLLIYPSIAANVPGLGLEFKLSAGSVYDRGKTSQNREEARLVIEAALEHYRTNPDKSLGIGAFSSKQQQALLDELERHLTDNPGMQEYFESKRPEYCFIKNLETIQGDERDVIFVSMGYGKGMDGRVLSNFGPINKEGGHRRLNVLMTRARERCVIFSNFGPEDLSLDEKSPSGVRALKRFLDYARYRNLAPTDDNLSDTDSPFEDFVKDFLQSHQYEVKSQVGCAGFRIDLAIVDPKKPGRYLLAVECDGSKYHTSAVVRDRDRLRQQILESMGWKNRIHRIWSTDWFHNFSLASQKLLEAIEAAKSLTDFANIVSPSVNLVNNSGNTIERIDDDLGLNTDNPFDLVSYSECRKLHVSLMTELHQNDPADLAKAVESVVRVEGPIHLEEVIRRIRTLLGISRAGSRIREAIETGVKYATSHGMIRKRANFLWPIDMQNVRARKRAGGIFSVEYITAEEYEDAIRSVLHTCYATEENTLIVSAARALGFQRVSEDISRHINRILKSMLRTQQLTRNAQDMIDLAK